MVEQIKEYLTEICAKKNLDTKIVHKNSSPNSDNLREIVKNAEWPSDIHGVLEKIAFRIYEFYVKEGDEKPALVNWEEAKDIFCKWARHTPVGVFSNEESTQIQDYLQEVLNQYAKTHEYCSGTDFDHWVTAQNELADSICSNFLS